MKIQPKTELSALGVPLLINDGKFDLARLICIDVETDEQDNFVGIALYDGGESVSYFTDLLGIKDILENAPHLLGHNIKGDAKWLQKWGIDIKPGHLAMDTILMSYVQSSTKDSHGLKDLAKEYLGLSWPTYKEMVHPDSEHPTKKVTLDKQPVEKVAQYCAADAIATYRLYHYFVDRLTKDQKTILLEIELPLMRILYETELAGVRVDIDYLKKLDKEFEDRITELVKKIPVENPNSNKQIADWLEKDGIRLPTTKKGNRKVSKDVLEKLPETPGLVALKEYNKLEKLKSTYTTGLLSVAKGDRIYTSFNQITKDEKGNEVGIITNRLSSSNPNLQNIPTRTDEGKKIRTAFLANENEVLIDADYSQIEPRLVAHFSQDRFFLRVFNEGRDIYSELVEGTGRTRADGKTFMLALLYGAQAEKLASVFKCSTSEATKILDAMWAKIPGVKAWRNRVIYNARISKGVHTLHRRWIPLPKIASRSPWEREHWERVAVNSVIQGSAAEIIKKAVIECRRIGWMPLLTVHDENLFSVPVAIAENVVNKDINPTMESVVKLLVPLKVESGIGLNWGEAKA